MFVGEPSLEAVTNWNQSTDCCPVLTLQAEKSSLVPQVSCEQQQTAEEEGGVKGGGGERERFDR